MGGLEGSVDGVWGVTERRIADGTSSLIAIIVFTTDLRADVRRPFSAAYS